MPELSVTEEQLQRLETVRTELEAAFLDGYGHIRRHDAVEYLLDNYIPPAEQRVRDALDREVRDAEGNIDYPTLQSVARETEGVKGSGMGAQEMYEAVVEAKLGEVDVNGTDGVTAGANGLDRDDQDDRADPAETNGTDGADGADDTDGADGEDEAAQTDGSDAPDDADTSDESDQSAETDGSELSETGMEPGGETSNGNASASSNGSGGSPLEAMMNLLKTHDDKWRKASSGEAPYEVDLPDGGTESARTKDDVKRILFTNY